MSGEEKDEEETLVIFHTSTQVKASKEPWSTTMVIDQVPVRMETDTSSGKSLTGKDIWKLSQEETGGDTGQSHDVLW